MGKRVSAWMDRRQQCASVDDDQDTMSEAELQPAVPRPKHRWFQFTLRSLLIVVTLCAIPCSWLAVRLQRERAAAADIIKLGGFVIWHRNSFGPLWLRHLVGDDCFQCVICVDFRLTQVTDEKLENLKRLDRLEQLDLFGNYQVTDVGLDHLKVLPQLQEVYLGGTAVTDAGVKKLQQALPNCKITWKPPTKYERQSPAAPDQLR
jgi:hypothetical protein